MKVIFPTVPAIISLLLLLTPALAQDFSMKAEDLAYALVKNTISNLEVSNKFVKIIENSDKKESVYQNLWGLIYGTLVLMAANNEVTSVILEEVSNSKEYSSKVGEAISMLGENSSVVFGDLNGTQGLTLVLRKETEVLQNSSYMYNERETIVEAYARVVSEFTYSSVTFLINLFDKLDEAWR